MVRCPPSTPSSPPPDTPGSRLSKFVNTELFDELRALHADEFAYLQKRLKGTLDEWDKSWWRRCLEIIVEYVKFVAETWYKCGWYVVFFPPTLADWFSMISLSFGACAVMTVLLPFCLLASFPAVKSHSCWLLKALFNDVSIANIAYPRIFKDLTEDHVRAAREHLSKPPKRMSSPDSCQARVFNLDAAKLLLQCAALMYERTAKQTRNAARSAADNKVLRTAQSADVDHQQPGSHIRRTLGEKSAEAVDATLHKGNEEEDMIRKIANEDLGLQYYPISELNSLGSAFCALFWDPADSFIIVSFKGTTPTDFMDWRTDFTFHRVHANHWINGFDKVHGGFMDKIFPRQIKHSSIPYNTIIKAIQTVASSLTQNRSGDAKINVWITGHSLGCALASVAYSRMVTEIGELGPNVHVRDAYLFAAPVVCDVVSAGAFNNRMNHFSKEHNYQKTMWRVTNGLDAVACSLPEAGDYTQWAFTPWNLFTFSHLGSEIKLRAAPNKCIVTGHHITPGTTVRIESAFKQSAEDREVTPLQQTLTCLQNLPIVGRLVAHAPGFYWSSLLEVGAGECEWKEDY